MKLVTSLPRTDETKNFALADAAAEIANVIGTAYKSATLFCTTQDLSLDYSRKDVPRLIEKRPSLSAKPVKTAHDRARDYIVPADRAYLARLGVADEKGHIKQSMQGKYRQICHFIEIVDGLLVESGLAGASENKSPVSIVDIGSGKGYLTFALYDHIISSRDLMCEMQGIEVRRDMVQLCGDLARSLAFSGLKFVEGHAASAATAPADVVVALHACDTATDDAMAFGVLGGSRLIVTAPCCQHELAPQLSNAQSSLGGILKFGLLKQRQADLITDAARALLLEASGYKVKVIEFVSTEHTAKNVLIAAIKSDAVKREDALRQYENLKREFGFETQHLANRLSIASEP